MDGPVGLGHRRLAIIDLTTGDQPVFNEAGDIGIVFNGEIYNYVELRTDLESRGHVFRTHSDTETIVHAYEEWGTECVQRFNGMWAFALWDKTCRKLWLSRDRLGEKPLYYAEHDGTLFFGSEIKALLAAGVPAVPDLRPLELYLTFSYVPAPMTMFKNIHQLEPGCSALIERGAVRISHYWEPPWIPEDEMRTDEKNVCEEFIHLLEDSIRLRLRSDVPFGAFLSGGLDSSSIVYWMSRLHPDPVHTFTIGFAEKEYDERKLARLVAKACRTQHHEFEVNPERLDAALTQVVEHYDDPFGDPSAIPTGVVSSLAAQQVKMVLTGDGGDEVLSGYTGYQGEKFSQMVGALPSGVQQAGSRVLSGLRKAGGAGIRRRLLRFHGSWEAAQMPFVDRLAEKSSRGRGADLSPLRQAVPEMISQREYLHNLFSRAPFQQNFYKLMYFNLKCSLPHDMLTKVDRMSMAYALETRVPFLDHRLVELMVKVHSKVKLPGFERKHVLRKVMQGRLPAELWTARKRGFTVPLSRWFAGDLAEQYVRTLTPLADMGMSQQWLESLLKDNRDGTAQMGNFMWMLLVLNKWIETYK